MVPHIEDIEDDEGPLTEGEYEEGLDDEYDDEDEDYDEEADLIDDDGIDDEEPGGSGEGFIKGLEPLQGKEQAGSSSSRDSSSSAAKPWTGLESLPAATRETYVKLLGQLRGQDKKEITILILGKYFTGKSATANSLLNEDAAGRSFMQRTSAPPAQYVRASHGFQLRIIDVNGLADLDTISEARVAAVVQSIRDIKVDVLLYVDRFDYYRVDGADEQILRAITRSLGVDIWKNAILGLTHATETVNGYEWGEFAAKRSERMQQAVRRHAGCPTAALPVALIENSATCPKNDEGQRALPDGTAWLPALWEKVVEIATSQVAFRFDPGAVERAANPNKKLRWLIPVIFAAQIAFKVFVLDRLMSEDTLTGDRSGPFDASVVRANRARAAAEKAAARDRATRRVRQPVATYESDSDSD